MNLIGNILWLVLGGLVMGLAWWLAGLLAFVSILGIPWGRACFVLGSFAFWPFGRDVVSRYELYGRHDTGTGPLGTVGNIIWFVLAGVWLGIGHVLSAAACAVTIIGIPFAWQHLKLASLALWPIGRAVVTVDEARAARARRADEAGMRPEPRP